MLINAWLTTLSADHQDTVNSMNNYFQYPVELPSCNARITAPAVHYTD